MAFPTVNLSWTTQPGATSYELERSANDSASWSAVATITAPTVTYADNPAVDTDWSYRVRAVNGYGNSAWSNVKVAELSTLVNLDANDLDTGAVGSWPDAGVRGTLVYQPEAGYRPNCEASYGSAGHQAVYFTDNTTYIGSPPVAVGNAVWHMVFSNLSGDLDLGVTIFFVGQTVADATSRPWLALDVGGANEIRLNSTYTSGNPGSVLAEASGSSVVSENLTTFGSGPTTGEPALFTVRITPTELKYWRSNNLLHTASVSSALLDTARSTSRLMARDDLDQGDMGQAYLQELLIKNRPMSDTEITAKQYELISKWGLTL